MQEQMQGPVHKLIQEVDTRWNSTHHMLQRLFEERQAVGAALATLRNDVRPLSSEDYDTITACLKLLGEESLGIKDHPNDQNAHALPV